MTKKAKESGVLNKPRFAPADVIDLSYRHLEALPNRLIIRMVYMKVDSCEWMYDTITETSGDCKSVQMKESFIVDRMCNKFATAYKDPFVIKMYEEGYRWAGNFPTFIATDKAKKLIPLDNISSIMLYDAVRSTGGKMNDYLGIWVKYNTTIGNNGTITTRNINVGISPIVIK